MKEINVNVNMKVKNMYEFLMRHAYVSVLGVASLLFSVLSFVYLCMNYSEVTQGKLVMLIVASLLFTVINPIWIYVNAAKQVKLNPTFKDQITYVFSETGIKVVQNEQELPIEWEEVQKVIETKKNVIIYLSKVRAFVIPQEDLAGNKKDVVELIEKSVDTKFCHLKKA